LPGALISFLVDEFACSAEFAVAEHAGFDISFERILCDNTPFSVAMRPAMLVKITTVN
jgi:hypothetical protein